MMKPKEQADRDGRAEDSVRMDLEAWARAQSPASNRRLREIALDNFHVNQEMTWKLQVNPDPPAFERLSEVHAPTLFIAGDRDVPAQILRVENIYAHMPLSRKIVIEGADHFPNMSKPDEFNKIVLGFLQEQTLAVRA